MDSSVIYDFDFPEHNIFGLGSSSFKLVKDSSFSKNTQAQYMGEKYNSVFFILFF